MITTTEWGLHPDAESLSRFETVRLLEVNPTTWSDGRRGETLVMPATVQTNSPPGNAKTFRAARRWASSTRVWRSALPKRDCSLATPLLLHQHPATTWRRRPESVASSDVSAQIMPDFAGYTSQHCHCKNQHLYYTFADVFGDSLWVCLTEL